MPPIISPIFPCARAPLPSSPLLFPLNKCFLYLFYYVVIDKYEITWPSVAQALYVYIRSIYTFSLVLSFIPLFLG